jgi:hypothetical protein
MTATVVNIASNVTTTGITSAIVSPLARFYLIQIAIPTGTATAVPQFSMDGINFWTPSLTNVSNDPTVQLYQITDYPVIGMRLNVTAIDGATLRADFSVIF